MKLDWKWYWEILYETSLLKSALKIYSLGEINYVVLSGKLIYFPVLVISAPLGLTSASSGYSHLGRLRSYKPTEQCYVEQNMVWWLKHSIRTELMFLCCIFISCSRIKINSFYNIIFTETRFTTLEKECDVKKILMPGKAIRHTCPKSTGDLGRTLRLISSFSMQVSQSLLRGKQNIIRPIFQCSTTQRHIYNNQC